MHISFLPERSMFLSVIGSSPFPTKRPFHHSEWRARSRLQTSCEWREANVSDVLLTCWANNFCHQQFYLAPHVPAVKLTMHAISIRQENDPRCPHVHSDRNVCRWKDCLPFCEVYHWWTQHIRVNLVREGWAATAHCCLYVWWFEFTSTLCSTCPSASSFLIRACVACSNMNHVSCTCYASKPYYLSMMSPHCRYLTVTLQVCTHIV